MPEKLINVKEAAEILNIPRFKIRQLVEKGELPAYKIGGKYIRFRKEQVEAIRDEVLTKVDSTISPPMRQKENSRYTKEVVYTQSLADSILDFFYFKDFYIIAAIIILILLFFIFH